MEWIAEYVVALFKGEVFEVFFELVSFCISYLIDLLPPELLSVWQNSYFGQLLSDFGNFDGVIDDASSALAGGYCIFTHFFPFKAVVGELLLCYGLIAFVRGWRWVLATVPGLNF